MNNNITDPYIITAIELTEYDGKKVKMPITNADGTPLISRKPKHIVADSFLDTLNPILAEYGHYLFIKCKLITTRYYQ